MTPTYSRFNPPRRLSEYAALPGHEIGGRALTPVAFDALSESKTKGLPCEYVVIGETRHDDGTFYLSFGVPLDHIEANTDYRLDRDANRLRLVCPNCGLKDGKHTKSCDR